jgi:hypothetical protein
MPSMSPPKRLLAVLGGVMFAVLVAEIVCRVNAFFPGAAWDPVRAKAFFEARSMTQAAYEMRVYGGPDQHVSEADALPYVHPYTGWTNAATDALAARMVDETARDGAMSFDLLLLGGSVAGNMSEHAVPRLAAALRAEPAFAGKEVRVWNFARPAYRAPQPLHWLEWLLALGARPEAVLLVDGFNETAMSLEHVRRGVHPAYPSASYWAAIARGANLTPELLDQLAAVRLARQGQLSIARQARDFGLHRSALLTRLAESRLRASSRAVEAASSALRAAQARAAGSDRALTGPRIPETDEAAVNAALLSWEASARALHAICAARAIASLQVVQPTLADAGAKRPSEEERSLPAASRDWEDAIRAGYPLLRERAAALALEGLPVVDATRAFASVEETYFVDVVHFNEAGNEALGDWIAPRLLARLR